MNKPKQKGTRNETRRVRAWHDAGVNAGRLAEGGLHDLGDLWVGNYPHGPGGDRGWIEEAKERANLNPHRTLHDAIRKAGHPRVLLSHKRLTRKDGNQRRTPDGEPEVVVVRPDVAAVLLRAFLELEAERPVFVDGLWAQHCPDGGGESLT